MPGPSKPAPTTLAYAYAEAVSDGARNSTFTPLKFG